MGVQTCTSAAACVMHTRLKSAIADVMESLYMMLGLTETKAERCLQKGDARQRYLVCANMWKVKCNWRYHDSDSADLKFNICFFMYASLS